jgi:hypothetical protein
MTASGPHDHAPAIARARLSRRRTPSGGLAGDLAGVYQERLKTWLVSVAFPLRENAVGQAVVNARRVLGHLGFDLILQVNPGHLG